MAKVKVAYAEIFHSSLGVGIIWGMLEELEVLLRPISNENESCRDAIPFCGVVAPEEGKDSLEGLETSSPSVTKRALSGICSGGGGEDGEFE